MVELWPGSDLGGGVEVLAGIRRGTGSLGSERGPSGRVVLVAGVA